MAALVLSVFGLLRPSSARAARPTVSTIPMQPSLRAGDAAFTAGKTQAALAFYRAACERTPGDPAPWTRIGTTLQALGNPRGARRAWREALLRAPNHSTIQSRLRALLDAVPTTTRSNPPPMPTVTVAVALAQRRPAEAFVLRPSPSRPEPLGDAIRHADAEALLALGRLNEAARAFERAPESLANTTGMAIAYILQGRRDAADPALERWLGDAVFTDEELVRLRPHARKDATVSR